MRKLLTILASAAAGALLTQSLVSLAGGSPTLVVFDAGSVISSADVNGNFAALQGYVAGLPQGAQFGQALSGAAPGAAGFSVTNTDATGVGLVGVHSSSAGLAPAILGTTNSPDDGAIAVSGVVASASSGVLTAAVKGENPGLGPGIGVWGDQAGGGWGVYGSTDGGTGVRGTSRLGHGVVGRGLGPGGVGVLGSTADDTTPGVAANANSTAGIGLSLLSGQFQVSGAGVETTTAAFVHQATTGNVPAGYPDSTLIDSPLTNGNPDVLLIVTQNRSPHVPTVVTYNPHPVGVWYDGTNWYVFNEDRTAMPVGASFNILVIHP